MQWRRLFVLSLSLALAACAGNPRVSRSPATPAHPPGVKIGAPYEVYGIRYVPADDRTYDERGVASWYGPNFHQKETANGERYDQNEVTAAHKTLPMPSWVEVQNLDNGRRLTVRINDRGPFVSGRIIDLSRRSAELLGVVGPGLAHVRVRRVFPAGDWARIAPVAPPVVQLASAAQTPAPAPSAPPAAPPLAAPMPATPPAPAVPAPGARYIQVAALSDEGRAKALASVLADFGPAAATPIAGGLWRVRIGPLADEQVDDTLYEVRTAGYREAVVVR